MSKAAQRRINVAEFYDWLRSVEGRYELVDGQPVMMAVANNRHDRITRNALRCIGNHLDGHRCQPFTADIYIPIPAGNRRQGDMGIDCGTPDDNSMEADVPTMVMEILSPTTRVFDRNDKLEECKTVPSRGYIILVDPEFPQVRRYYREPDRVWSSNRVAGIDSVLELPLFDLRLPLSALYAGLAFRARPTLVPPENAVSTPGI
jgi:Uma2 family endonuclease